MTVAQIGKELNQQELIHTVAREIAETIDAATCEVARLGGDADAARERILELVTE